MVTSLNMIMPVCNQSRFTKEILEMVEHNTVIPDRIIVIDNASTDDTPDILKEFSKRLPLEVIRNERNISVNASWNVGVARSDADLLAILNNDLVIPPYFFEMGLHVVQKHPKCGAFVPTTVANLADLSFDKPDKVILEPLPWREGWAFFIRRIICMAGGPIPDSIVTFYGDDFMFHITQEQGYNRMKMKNVTVFHYLSQSHGSPGGIEHFGQDEINWRVIRDTRGNGKRPDPKIEWSKVMEKYYDEKNTVEKDVVEKKARIPYDKVPLAIDMAPYAKFYQDVVKQVVAQASHNGKRTFVDVGTRYGCAARIIADALPEDENWRLILIDFALTGTAKELIDDVRIEFFKGDHLKLASKFKTDSVDFVHIDVDPHSYEQTKQFFEIFSTKVRQGGAIIFHDCTSLFGVLQAVKEIEANPAWQVFYCTPAPESTISAPAVAYRRKK